uniref:Uncharacterized protein n=1 Tax=Arundo donax TaxID=35708 RepID=A0A0A8Z0B6_ARUDO
MLYFRNKLMLTELIKIPTMCITKKY